MAGCFQRKGEGYGIRIGKIPFSRYGSYFAVSINQEDGCLYLRDLHGGDETCSDIYEMRFPEIGERQRFIRTESELMWFREGQAECWLKICMDRDGRVHFLADGLVLELHARGGRYDTLVPLDERRMEHHFIKTEEVSFYLSARADNADTAVGCGGEPGCGYLCLREKCRGSAAADTLRPGKLPVCGNKAGISFL